MTSPLFHSPGQRHRAVALAVALARGTPLAPQSYERYLLALFQRGQLTLAEVEELLTLSVYQVLYHSHATSRPSEPDLAVLLAQSRAYNAQHQITGLLLYSQGRFVQVLEGQPAAVQALYARIQRDPCHEQVVTVYQGAAPQRCFAESRMDFRHVAGLGLTYLLDSLLCLPPCPELPLEDPCLQALLEAFRPHLLTQEIPA